MTTAASTQIVPQEPTFLPALRAPPTRARQKPSRPSSPTTPVGYQKNHRGWSFDNNQHLTEVQHSLSFRVAIHKSVVCSRGLHCLGLPITAQTRTYQPRAHFCSGSLTWEPARICSSKSADIRNRTI